MNITSLTGKKNKRAKGIAAVLALIMAVQIVIIGAAMHATARREVLLTTLAEDSVRAFIAAESAMECVLFQDTRIGNFGTETPVAFWCDAVWNMNYTPPAEPNDAILGIPDGENRVYDPIGETTIGYGNYPNGPCADIYITKDVQLSGFVQTNVWTKGRSVCNPSATQRLERGVITVYPI